MDHDDKIEERDIQQATPNSLDQSELWKVVPVSSKKKKNFSYNERSQSSSSKDIKQPILSYNERNQSSSSKDIKQQTSARTIDLTVEEESQYERDIAEATINSLDQTELWKVVPVTSNSKFESMLLINNYV